MGGDNVPGPLGLNPVNFDQNIINQQILAQLNVLEKKIKIWRMVFKAPLKNLMTGPK